VLNLGFVPNVGEHRLLQCTDLDECVTYPGICGENTICSDTTGSFSSIFWSNTNTFAYYWHLILFLLGYLKTRIRWMGGSIIWPPPPLNPVFDITNYTPLKISYAPLLESAKKLQLCKNCNFLCKIHLYSKNFGIKMSARIDKIYIFEKPMTMPFQICKKYCKILNNLMCN